MTDPIAFASSSPRYRLPLLFAGQAQKEFFVNEAHALTDALLHPAIEGVAANPPANPQEGDCWLVGASPSGDWAGHSGSLASFQAGAWLFIEPRDGMRILDRSARQEICFRDGWRRAVTPVVPEGGATIDTEARTAIAQLVTALVAGGILAE